MNKYTLLSLLPLSISAVLIIHTVNATETRKLTPAFTPESPSLYGRQLLEHSDRVLQGWKDEIVSGKMQLFDARNRSVQRSFTRIGLERFGRGDKSIIKFTAPADIKGVSALNYENIGSSDDNWLYLPSSKKVRRISGANNTASFQGSEFTYEDLNDLDPKEYEWTFIEETTLEIDAKPMRVFKISGKPTYRDTAYSKLILYLSKAHWYQTKVEYFDKSGTHLKTKISSQWQQFHGQFWRSHKVDMSNHLTGRKTQLSFSNFLVDLSQYTSKKTGKKRNNLKENLFTKRALIK